MTGYLPGQRLRLLTATPFGGQPGDAGTVRCYDPARHAVMVEFDNGLSGPLPVPDENGIEALPTDEPVLAHGRMLAGVYAAGRQAGGTAADIWARHTFAGRSTADAVFTAHAVIAGIAENEPAVRETLPEAPEVGGSFGREVLATVTARHSGWQTLTPRAREDVQQSYRDGFAAGSTDRIVERCDELINAPRPGSVFAAALGDGVGAAVPAWARHHSGERYTIGFAALVHDASGTDIVFGCTRTVAEAITADLRQHHGKPAGPAQNRSLGVLYHDGDTTVISEQHLLQRPRGLDRLDPDREPEYQVRAPAATWSLVAADRCDRIIGDLAQRRQLTETGPLPVPGLQVPHRRLRLVRLRPPLVAPGSIFTAAILWDGAPVGGLHGWGTAGIGIYLSDPAALSESTLRRYLADCRLAGQTVPEIQALRALADESLLCEAIDEAYEAGSTLLRLPDPAGYTVLREQLTPIPDRPAAVQDLSQRIARDRPGENWQIWTGHRWLPLPPAALA